MTTKLETRANAIRFRTMELPSEPFVMAQEVTDEMIRALIWAGRELHELGRFDDAPDWIDAGEVALGRSQPCASKPALASPLAARVRCLEIINDEIRRRHPNARHAPMVALPSPPELHDRRITVWAQSIGGGPQVTYAQMTGDLRAWANDRDYPTALRNLEAMLLAQVADCRRMRAAFEERCPSCDDGKPETACAEWCTRG